METATLKNLNASSSEPRMAESAVLESVRAVGEGASNSLRVAHVMPWPGLGGVATAALRLACALEETGEVRNLAFCHGGRTRVGEMFEGGGIETVGYEAGDFSYRHPSAYLRGTRRFQRLLREHEIDIVHSADLMGVYHAGLACTLARVPLVCHIRSNFEDMLWQYKPPLRAASHFVFVSQAVWQNFDTIFRVPRKRGTVIYDWGPDASDEEGAGTARARVREEFQIETDAPVIGMIARVQPPKDFETLIRAMAKVVESHQSARLLIIGEYDHPHCLEHYRALRALSEELRLGERIIWAGLRRDVPDLIRAMDVCVLSTHAEGMPLVLLEAMALGCPVVATRAGGIPELITHGENGLLHEKNDYQELARGVLSLLDDGERAARIGRRGQEHVRANFNREKTINATRNLYARLKGAPHASLAADARSS
jgi:glycosyltransferase involved in cell wall biosynthesis